MQVTQQITNMNYAKRTLFSSVPRFKALRWRGPESHNLNTDEFKTYNYIDTFKNNYLIKKMTGVKDLGKAYDKRVAINSEAFNIISPVVFLEIFTKLQISKI